MIVYAETNFVLEHALGQEQSESCEELLALAERGAIRLVVPAFSLVEARVHQRVSRQRRIRLREELDGEVRQLRRSTKHSSRVEELGGLTKHLIESVEEDAARLDSTLDRLERAARIIPLDAKLASDARSIERDVDLSPQDALVLSAVLADLGSRTERAPTCFLNRNSRDFDDPGIAKRLADLGCRLILRFDDGLKHVMSAPRR